MNRRVYSKRIEELNQLIKQYKDLGYFVFEKEETYEVYSKFYKEGEEVIWLGEDRKIIKNGSKLIVTSNILAIKETQPFYKYVRKIDKIKKKKFGVI